MGSKHFVVLNNVIFVIFEFKMFSSFRYFTCMRRIQRTNPMSPGNIFNSVESGIRNLTFTLDKRRRPGVVGLTACRSPISHACAGCPGSARTRCCRTQRTNMHPNAWKCIYVVPFQTSLNRFHIILLLHIHPFTHTFI